MKKIKLVLVIIWMIVIFMFSNQTSTNSSKLSNTLIIRTVRIIEKINHKTYSNEEIENFIKPVRKLAHFTIYFVLGILIFLYIKEYDLNNKILISILLCLIYALTDEIHQLFIIGRSGQILDVIIDTLGSSLGIFIMKKYER